MAATMTHAEIAAIANYARTLLRDNVTELAGRHLLRLTGEVRRLKRFADAAERQAAEDFKLPEQ